MHIWQQLQIYLLFHLLKEIMMCKVGEWVPCSSASGVRQLNWVDNLSWQLVMASGCKTISPCSCSQRKQETKMVHTRTKQFCQWCEAPSRFNVRQLSHARGMGLTWTTWAFLALTYRTRKDPLPLCRNNKNLKTASNHLIQSSISWGITV